MLDGALAADKSGPTDPGPAHTVSAAPPTPSILAGAVVNPIESLGARSATTPALLLLTWSGSVWMLAARVTRLPNP